MEDHSKTPEVSCGVLGVFFRYAEHLGRDVSQITQGLNYSEKHLNTPHARIDYQTFRTICQRFAQLFADDPDACYRAGLKIFDLSSFGFINILISLVKASPHLLYASGKRLVPLQFSMIQVEYQCIEERKGRLRYNFEDGYEVFPEFVDVVRGLTSAMVTLAGGEPAEVEHKLTENGFILDVQWAQRPGIINRIRKVTIDRIKSYQQAGEELQRSHTLLEAQLAEAQELSDRLQTLVSIGQSVERGFDSKQLITDFSSELERCLDISVVFASLDRKTEVGDEAWLNHLSHIEIKTRADAPNLLPLHAPLSLIAPGDEVRAHILQGQEGPFGILVLKAPSRVFAKTDSILLHDALSRLRHALQNVIHYQELEEHRRSLEAKVAERTAELRSHTEQLEESNQKLMEIDQAKRRFFTHMTHELKNPITLLTSSIEALEQKLSHDVEIEPSLRDNLLKMLGISRQNIKRVGTAADDLMDLAMLEESRLQPRLMSIDLVELSRTVLDETSLWCEKLSVSTVLDASDPVPHISGDRRLLAKLLLNLLGNAIKFSPTGESVTLQVFSDENNVQVRILDRGPGVPADQRDRIFQPFEQTDDGQMIRAERGIGIGLSLAREITQLHGGELFVQDRQGGGSVFVFKVPRAPQSLSGEEKFESSGTAGPSLEDMVYAHLPTTPLNKLPTLLPDMGSTSETADNPTRVIRSWPDQSKHKVLLVDDEADILSTVGDMLKHDFDVALASSAEIAIELIDRFTPDAVVSDIVMRGMSGMQLCQHLRQSPATRNIPILLITALGELQDKLRGFEHGADDYITKPFQYAELSARIKTQIRLRQLSADAVAFSNIAVIGTMAAGIAHELKNPLNVLLNCLQPLWEELSNSDISARTQTLLELIDDASHRLDSATRSFSNMVTHSATPVPLDLRGFLNDLIRTRNARTKDRVKISFQCHVEEPVVLSKGRFSLVVGNLLDNAIDAVLSSENGGNVTVAIQENGNELLLCVEDDGVGMDRELLERSVTLFASTKKPGKGSGLGLSVVRQIVLAEGGRFELASTLGEGTTATIWYPLAEPPNTKHSSVIMD